MLLEAALVLDVALALALLHLEERRLRDVEIAALDQLPHLPEEEREEQRADVAAVDVGVGHDDDLVVAGLLDVEVLADPAADGRDERLDLLAREHLVEPRALHVQDLAANRQNRLGLARAALLGRAAGGVALDDEELRLGRIALLAVGELPGQAVVRERPLAAREIARLARRRAGARGVENLRDDRPGDARVLLEVVAELLVEDVLHEAAHLARAELGLGLALELGLRELHGDHRREAFARVVAAEVDRRILAVLLILG